MSLCVSALAWPQEDDLRAFETLHKNAVAFVELIPARCVDTTHTKDLLKKFNLTAIAFQSLLYGAQNVHLFQDEKSRDNLFEQLKKVFSIAMELGIVSCVFGSPAQRNYNPQQLTAVDAEILALSFFKKLGEQAKLYKTRVCLEPNPAIYNTNFLNTTLETVQFLKKLSHPQILLNLDLGALTLNKEDLILLWPEIQPWIGHIHWSAPQLLPLSEFDFSNYGQLQKLLALNKPPHWDGVISLEMKQQPKRATEDFLQKELKFVSLAGLPS